MSDLTATGCGGRDDNCGALVLILLLFCCGGLGGSGFDSCGGGFGDTGCNSVIWIILILCLCGNGGFGC